MNLTHQINARRELSEASSREERRADRRFIRATQATQNLEHAALQKKDAQMK